VRPLPAPLSTRLQTFKRATTKQNERQANRTSDKQTASLLKLTLALLQDISALYELAQDRDWPVAITHIQSLADGDAVDQLFQQDHVGWTAIMFACSYSAPLELVQLMATKAKLDSRKRCLLAITSGGRRTALHLAAAEHSDLAVLSLLIREYWQVLFATDLQGHTPLQFAIDSNRPAHVALLTDTTNALASSDYAALADRVHGDERRIRCLMLPPARRAVRVSLLHSI